jgi:hypothetical protein
MAARSPSAPTPSTCATGRSSCRRARCRWLRRSTPRRVRAVRLAASGRVH